MTPNGIDFSCTAHANDLGDLYCQVRPKIPGCMCSSISEDCSQSRQELGGSVCLRWLFAHSVCLVCAVYKGHLQRPGLKLDMVSAG